jgi:HK97 family phage portal protein
VNLLSRLKDAWSTLRADAGTVSYRPDSDFWYQGTGYQTATGLRVSPESAMRVAAVYACVRVVAETVASLPLIIYKATPDGGKVRATDHPLFDRLHDAPNPWQTSFEFIEMMQAHLELRGNAFAKIIAGPTRAIDQLIPVHPDRVNVFRLANGRLQYQVRYLYSAQLDILAQEEMFHMRGMSQDGLVGLSTIGVGAETVASGMAAQEYAGRFFENDSTPSGVLVHPKNLTDAAHDRIKASFRAAHSGQNQHSLAIIEEGMTYQNIGMSNRDSQLLEARQFSRGDIASIFRVPPHKIGDLSRSTFSNIEQQNIEFATDCIRPRLVRLERKINEDLIEPLAPGNQEDIYFCEFLMDALLRGDLKSRYEAYSVGINAGFLTRNEARSAENLNPIVGLDVPLMPLNLGPVGADGRAIPTQTGSTDNSPVEDQTSQYGARHLSPGNAAHLKQFINAAAERVVRKELKALRAIDKRAASSEFRSQIVEFYRTHGPYVAEQMRLRDHDIELMPR